MFHNGLSSNYKSDEPHIDYIQENMEVYPYIQTAVENNFFISTQNLKNAIPISETQPFLERLYPNIKVNTNSGILTRESLLEILSTVPSFNEKVAKHKLTVENKQKQYVGSSVSSFIMGNSAALDKIELSKYRSRNMHWEEMFWEVAGTEDIKYQHMHEDYSSEGIDILTKRLNKALLSFYDAKFWITIDECNLILKEKVDHTGALALKGSAFYMLQDFSKAKKYWKRVLFYQPNNKEVLYFLKTLE